MTADGAKTEAYEAAPVTQTLEQLGVAADQGLIAAEIDDRHRRYGYNEVKEREEPLWHRVFRRFWGPIPWMIETAALLSALVEKWEDFFIILLMLLVNAGLDFFQEHRALNALAALKQKLTKEVAVRRDGTFQRIPVRDLVPGDIIKLRIGDIVPADVQLIEGDYLLIDQASLTRPSPDRGRRRCARHSRHRGMGLPGFGRQPLPQ